MSLIVKQILINKFNLPKEMINIVKDYIFYKIKKIPKNDKRYQILLTIPYKEYDCTDNTTYVYLRISDEKDYYLIYSDFELQIQTLKYGDNNTIYFMDGSIFPIE